MTHPALARLATHLHRLAGNDPAATDDRDLLDRWTGQRDQAAFSALVERHGRFVLAVCRQILGDRQHAEDVLQAVFLTLAQKADTIRTDGALSCWLYRVAVNLARTASERIRLRRRAEEIAVTSRVSSQPHPSEQMMRQELEPLLHDEIERLPEIYRQPIVLCYLQGLTHEQTAAQLGVPTGTVKGRLVRARERLRDRLARLGHDLPAVPLPLLPLAGTTGKKLASLAVLWTGGDPAVRSLLSELTRSLLGGTTLFTAGRCVSLLLVLLALMGSVVWAYSVEATVPVNEPADPGLLRIGPTTLRHAGNVQQLVFSPNGRFLASTGEDGVAYLWNVGTGEKIRRIADPSASATTLAFSPDGRFLACGLSNGELIVQTLAEGRVVHRVPPPANVNFWVCLAFSADSSRLLACGSQVFAWRVADWKPIEQPRQPDSLNSPATLSADGATLAWLTTQMEGDRVTLVIRCWDTQAGRLVRTIRPDVENVIALSVSPDGRRLAYGTPSGAFAIFDIATGKEVARGAWPEQKQTSGPGAIRASTGVWALSFSPDGKELLVAGDGAETIVFDAVTAQQKRTLAQRQQGFRVIAWSGDGKTLASSEGNRIRLWDAASCKELHLSPGPTSPLLTLTESADGERLVALESDMQGHVIWSWDRAGKPREPVEVARLAEVEVAALSPDGNQLATLGNREPGQVQLWDAGTGKPTRKWKVDLIEAVALSFTPDGKHLLASGVPADRRGIVTNILSQPDGKPVSIIPFGGLQALAGSGSGLIQQVAEGQPLTVVKLPSGEVEQNVDARPIRPDKVSLSGDGRTVLICGVTLTENSLPIAEIRDLADGQRRTRLLLPLTGDVVQAVLSPDGRTAATASSIGEVYLWDTRTGRAVARLRDITGALTTLAFSRDSRRLLAAGYDGTVVSRDLGKLPMELLAGKRTLTEEELNQLWEDLKLPEGDRVDRARDYLAGFAEQVLPRIRKLLPEDRPVATLPRLLADLDDDDFETREKAQQQLSQLGKAIEPALVRAQKEIRSIEVRRRLGELLEQLEGKSMSSERLQEIRAAEIRDRINAASPGR